MRLSEAVIEFVLAVEAVHALRHPSSPSSFAPPAPGNPTPERASVPSPPLRDMPAAMRALVTVREASEYLSVSPRTIWGLVAQRELSGVRVGRTVRIAVSELDAAIRRMQDRR
jgi:excisionase family DNA binding protein